MAENIDLNEAEEKLSKIITLFQDTSFQETLDQLSSFTVPFHLPGVIDKVHSIAKLLRDLKKLFQERTLIQLGNSLAITLPSEIVKTFDLKAGENGLYFRKDRYIILTFPKDSVFLNDSHKNNKKEDDN